MTPNLHAFLDGLSLGIPLGALLSMFAVLIFGKKK